MSRHQAVRNLDYEEVLDEYEGNDEGEYGGDGLSAEDRVALAEGTAEVQRFLGVEASKVTAEQIQEALWYYYYDLDKSVAYLTKKYINPPATKPSKKSPEGTFQTFLSYKLHCPALPPWSTRIQRASNHRHSYITPGHAIGVILTPVRQVIRLRGGLNCKLPFSFSEPSGPTSPWLRKLFSLHQHCLVADSLGAVTGLPRCRSSRL